MTLEERLGLLLSEKGLKIALAESCTGGLIAKRITDRAGSSAYFEGGLVTYSNGMKENLLQVPRSLLETRGAVSREVAEKMATGARLATGADLGLSVTGIAGPDGGTTEKPVGTVFMALAADTVVVKEHHFAGDRETIRNSTADEALKMAIDYLEGRTG